MKYFSTLPKLPVILGILLCTPANASWVQGAHVTNVSPVSMPRTFAFTIDQPLGNCPAGQWIEYQPPGADATSIQANLQANYAAMLSALLAHYTVNLSAPDPGCAVNLIQIS